MSADRFSGEIAVANSLRAFLKERGVEILQLVSPGGQAPLSITWTPAGGRRRTVYPDLVCIWGEELVVGELKAARSAADEKKLLDMRDSLEAREAILSMASRVARRELGRAKLVFALVHGEQGRDADREVEEWIVSPARGLLRRPPRRQ